MAKPIRVYADTSVYGGLFDPEFELASRQFLQDVRTGRFHIVLSAAVLDKIEVAPVRVGDAVRELLPDVELYMTNDDVARLQDAYLSQGIVGPRWSVDAFHVACATVDECQMIVSWNFRHIVHFDKIALYNGVNARLGYPAIGIYTPREVITYDD